MNNMRAPIEQPVIFQAGVMKPEWIRFFAALNDAIANSTSNGSNATGGTPALTFGVNNAAGAANTFIATDSSIALFDTTVPVTQAFGDAASTGSANVAARRDHKHGMMAAPSGANGGTPALVLSSNNAAGNATTFLRTNDQIAIFDTTAPSTQAFGDSAAVGTANYAARRDHKHGMMSDPSDTEQAITCANTVTIDFNSGRQAYMVFDRATSAITLANGTNGKVHRIRLTQDSSGNRTATWSTTVNWKAATTPVLTTTANKSDWITLVMSNGAWYGDIIKNF